MNQEPENHRRPTDTAHRSDAFVKGVEGDEKPPAPSSKSNICKPSGADAEQSELVKLKQVRDRMIETLINTHGPAEQTPLVPYTYQLTDNQPVVNKAFPLLLEGNYEQLGNEFVRQLNRRPQRIAATSLPTIVAPNYRLMPVLNREVLLAWRLIQTVIDESKSQEKP